jgi:hypothetical protein
MKKHQKTIVIGAGVAVLLYLLYRWYENRSAASSTAAGEADTGTAGAYETEAAEGADVSQLAGQEQSDVSALNAQETGDVSTLTTNLNAQVAQEAGDVSTLTAGIATNQSDIAALQTSMASETSVIASLQSSVASLASSAAAAAPVLAPVLAPVAAVAAPAPAAAAPAPAPVAASSPSSGPTSVASIVTGQSGVLGSAALVPRTTDVASQTLATLNSLLGQGFKKLSGTTQAGGAAQTGTYVKGSTKYFVYGGGTSGTPLSIREAA